MIQVLLNCARQEMPAELLAETQSHLAQIDDWELLVRIAWRHGLAPLLHKHLEAHVPNECKNLLRQSYVRAAVRSRTHAQAIAELVRAFEKTGVPLILLKGAALCLTTYCDPALRPFADIDLLIHEENIDAAKEALIACGYSLAPELLSEKLSRRFHANLPFAKMGDQPVHVELHWRLADRFSEDELALEDFWSRAQPIKVAEASALVLQTEDALTYLAAHLDKHGYLNQALVGSDDAASWTVDELSANRLIWFTDLHEIITRQTIDWAMVMRNDAVVTSLNLLHQLLGIEGIPLAFLEPHPSRCSKRLALNLARFAAKSESRRDFFRRHILATRQGFELRLVRLLDLWNFVFPRSGRSFRQSGRAIRQSLSLFFALLALRMRRR